MNMFKWAFSAKTAKWLKRRERGQKKERRKSGKGERISRTHTIECSSQKTAAVNSYLHCHLSGRGLISLVPMRRHPPLAYSLPNLNTTRVKYHIEVVWTPGNNATPHIYVLHNTPKLKFPFQSLSFFNEFEHLYICPNDSTDPLTKLFWHQNSTQRWFKNITWFYNSFVYVAETIVGPSNRG